MTQQEKEKMFLDLNSVLVKFWKEQGRPDKEVKIELLERMLNWYKKMGTATLDKQSKEPVNEGLEEATARYGSGYCDKGLRSTAEFGFRSGAEWQRQRTPMPEDTVLFNKGVAEGRRLEKQDMLKDAVEGEAHPNDCEIWVNLVGYGYKFNDGDKIKIVVIQNKEDKE